MTVTKNELLREMLRVGADWLFLLEDDVILTDARAVTGYVAACRESGWGHLMFHGHGPHNPRPLAVNGPVTCWPNYVGAWCVYSREALEEGGLMDEGFRWNCWEHVEHTLRLAGLGFCPPWRLAADATGSEGWLAELPGSIEHTSIVRDGRAAQQAAGCRYWELAHPDTYHLVFG